MSNGELVHCPVCGATQHTQKDGPLGIAWRHADDAYATLPAPTKRGEKRKERNSGGRA